MEAIYSIEKAILVSILEHYFVCSDEKIMSVHLNPEIFTNQIHKFFVCVINKLKEEDKPITSDYLRYVVMRIRGIDKIKFEVALLDIIIHNPIGTYELFIDYLDILEKEYIGRSINV